MQMNAIHRRHAHQAAAAVAVLLLTSWLGVARSGAGAPALPQVAPMHLQDAPSPDAGSALSAPSPPRRLNSSLSMPYFSFAQSLNPRS